MRGAAFVVARESTVGGRPGERALDDPPSRECLEGLLAGFLLHDLDRGGEDVFRPPDEGAGKARVGEQVPAAAVIE
ncbi:hypothetical protein ThrDRAFT_04691 [Frankia casuarinae]|nr:hypothetical protein ThrDRAFT_04691 [Frankia casuarinae]KDA40588.1 hypothetical protein BMG523Draft_04602 [Frankia sp. BMG5.23]KEZ34316.1 hypothetical protein CEDDRAFT_04336 [Frankia sp. CeD]